MERGTSSGLEEDHGSGSNGGGGIGGIIANNIHDTGENTNRIDNVEEIDNIEDGEDNSISAPHVCRGLSPPTVYKPISHVPRPHTSHFPLMRLPSELRIQIYRYLLEAPLVINASRMLAPSISHTTALMRKESLGLLTAINEVGFAVCCTYCTATQGPVTPAHQHFRETGKLMLDSRRQEWFAHSQVVFNGIRIRFICICCRDRCIGIIEIGIVDGQVKSGISEAPVPHQYSLTWTFAQNLGRLRPLLREIQERLEIPTPEGRSKMSKFKYSDLEEIAMCFRFAG